VGSGKAVALTQEGPSAICPSFPAGRLGKKMRFTGISVLRVKDGLITEELGLDDG
jgi:hypothetical protein